MREKRVSFSLVALVGANLIPLAGVLFDGWHAGTIVLLYWSENVIIGFYNVLKMALTRVEKPVFHLAKLFPIGFFCFHYGAFCAVHGFFIFTLFRLGGHLDSGAGSPAWPGPLVFVQLFVEVVVHLWRSGPREMIWPFSGLLISHGISFFRNYLGKGEYRIVSLDKLMGQPYKRIVILHVAIIGGGFLIMTSGSPLPLLVLLIFFKITLDIYLHIKSHRDLRKGRRGRT